MMSFPVSARFLFSVDQVRRAEQDLLAVQHYPDQLMQQASQVVADAAEVMLAAPQPPTVESGRVLLLVGAGGNGGDALYAGSDLLAGGRGVDAVLLGRDERVHIPALEQFLESGGRILDGLPLPQEYRLIIDGILGIGGRGGLAPEVAELLDDAHSQRIPILAVDLPSGIDADTGARPAKIRVQARGFADEDSAMRVQVVPAHVRADVTVTFGGFRYAHAIAPDCGEVICADLRILADGSSHGLRDSLFETFTMDFLGGAPEVQLSRSWPAREQRFDWSGAADTTFFPVSGGSGDHGREPEPDSDKYSGGVVGICAGSPAYRGAAVLCTTGAVRATSAMVRYIGSGWEEVVRALPEVVAHPDLASAGRVQAWVVGPGRGTDEAARTELAQLLERSEPLLIDADALTLLAREPELRELLRQRGSQTLLTPHAGEFRRLAEAVDAEIPDPEVDRIGAARALAQDLECGVLLKGRRTVLAHGQRVEIVDAGSSWGATAGSGDVLAGIAGALMAQNEAWRPLLRERFPEVDTTGQPLDHDAGAIHLHAVAAALAAQTPEGPAPTSASQIAAAVPRANAWLATRRDR